MSGRLTTHVLDISRGRPAEGMALKLYRLDGEEGRILLRSAVTNDDGRLNEPLLSGEQMVIGTYELVFEAGAYFHALKTEGTDLAFLDEVPVRFGIGDAGGHMHVPLLVAPGGYSTYRGS